MQSCSLRSSLRVARFGLVVLMLGSTPLGCHALVPVLSNIAAVVDDAAQVLTLIQSAYQSVAVENQFTPAQQQTAQAAIDRAWRALNIATRSVRGTTDLSDEEYAAAFGEFRAAYADLTKLLAQLGVVGLAPSGAAHVLTGSAAGRDIPVPLALGSVQ